MAFSDLLNELRNPGEGGVPLDLADRLEAAYNEAAAPNVEALEALNTKVAEATEARDKAITARETAVEANQRLLKLIPQREEPEGGTQEQGEQFNDGQITIDDLIEH